MGSGKGQAKRVRTGIKKIYVPEELIKPEVQFEGMDGNAFYIMSSVSKSLRKEGNSKEVIDEYMKQAQAGDYDHLLRVSMAFTEGELSFEPDGENVIDGTPEQIVERKFNDEADNVIF